MGGLSSDSFIACSSLCLSSQARSPSLVGRDGDVPVQTADGGKNQSTKLQRPSGGSDGVCECDKQTDDLGLPVRKPKCNGHLGLGKLRFYD